MSNNFEGKIVFGYGGLSDTTPCLYLDKGQYYTTGKMRKVSRVEIFNALRWNTDIVQQITSNQSYGYRHGGGLSNLYPITDEPRGDGCIDVKG